MSMSELKRWRWNFLTVYLFVVVLISADAWPAEAVTLVEDGSGRAAIVLPADPPGRQQRAAEELLEHIYLISGEELRLITGDEAPEDLLPVFIGDAANKNLDEQSRAEKDNPSSFTLSVAADRIDIRGLGDEGTLFGVYELLEQLGVRWYMPGEIGRVLPDKGTLLLQQQRTTQAPSMDYRRLQSIPRDTGWYERARLSVRSIPTGRHGLPGSPPTGTGNKVCLSGYHTPGALETVIESIRSNYEPTDQRLDLAMGPTDGQSGWCECDGCKALDAVKDPLYDYSSMTDRYIWFFNQVLNELEDEYPKLYISWYVYGLHMFPPDIEPHSRIIPVIAPHDQDHIRSMDSLMSPNRHILRWLIDEWSELSQEIYFRGYLNNLYCVNLPVSQVDRVRNDIPEFYEKGIRTMRIEVIRQSWANAPLTLYLASRMMWNVETDIDVLLDEFYEKFYGPAENRMRRYHEEFESAFRDTPYHTGSAYLYFPVFKNHPRRVMLRSILDDAQALVEGKDSLYAKRVRAVSKGYERLEHFLDMIRARNRHDFATAQARMEDFDRLSEELKDQELEPESGHRMLARGDFNRHFRPAIESGYHRTEEVGEIVKTLSDEWDFLLDPSEIGEIAGYYRGGELGGNWQPLKTTSRSWSDQGLHYFRGAAWYRTGVKIPKEYEGRPLYLWFGGVDREARVWVNGQFVGTSQNPGDGLPGAEPSHRVFPPFDMLATDAVNFGEKNWVAVKIENRSLHLPAQKGRLSLSVGTAGIVAPVMFWSPR